MLSDFPAAWKVKVWSLVCCWSSRVDAKGPCSFVFLLPPPAFAPLDEPSNEPHLWFPSSLSLQHLQPPVKTRWKASKDPVKPGRTWYHTLQTEAFQFGFLTLRCSPGRADQSVHCWQAFASSSSNWFTSLPVLACLSLGPSFFSSQKETQVNTAAKAKANCLKGPARLSSAPVRAISEISHLGSLESLHLYRPSCLKIWKLAKDQE